MGEGENFHDDINKIQLASRQSAGHARAAVIAIARAYAHMSKYMCLFVRMSSRAPDFDRTVTS